MIAAKIGTESRFRSLQIGVSQESFGESIQRNMSWAGYDRPLPPEMIPHKLFDRLFGEREEGWVNRKRSILDAVREDAVALEEQVRRRTTPMRVDEHLSAIRDLERAIAGLPAEYRRVEAAGLRRRHEGLAAHRQAAERSAGAGAGHAPDARCLLHADQVPGTLAIPVARPTAARHHDYTHADGKRREPTAPKVSASCATSAAGTSKSSPTCWPS